MQWWLARMPMQKKAGDETTISYQNQSKGISSGQEGPDPDSTDRVMLVRERKSRIYFLRKFFDYPLKLSVATIKNLGLVRMAQIGISYVWAMLFANKHPKNLEEFFY